MCSTEGNEIEMLEEKKKGTGEKGREEMGVNHDCQVKGRTGLSAEFGKVCKLKGQHC